jgi:hypothetical protein
MDYSEYSELLAQLVMMSNTHGDDTAEWNAPAPHGSMHQAPRMRPAVVPRFPPGAEQQPFNMQPGRLRRKVVSTLHSWGWG